ncbi:DoxX family protein [Streptomyces sp. SCUT-3]|uniref:DoxX family membrane protein n=1 Tax=Streptomyces sp. SCUT-3 TaxID=2684469 RepID=UPI0015FCE542
MTTVRRLARPLLASMFVYGGINSLKHPEMMAPAAKRVIDPLAANVSLVPSDPEQAVRINGAVHVVAGGLLALGRFPRLSALVLAGTLVPTTLAGHRFWEAEDPQERAQQQIHFFKNLSMLGGLLLASVDTAGKPSLNWQARHTARAVRREAQQAARTARREVRLAAGTARVTAPVAAKAARVTAPGAARATAARAAAPAVAKAKAVRVTVPVGAKAARGAAPSAARAKAAKAKAAKAKAVRAGAARARTAGAKCAR